MKRVIAVSDSHGRVERLRDVLFAVLSKAPTDVAVFLGDGCRDWDDIYMDVARAFPGLHLYCVKGNNDPYVSYSDLIRFKVGAANFIACHGHRHGVKTNLDRLEIEAVSAEAQVALYGHTHIASITNYFNCLFVNPGSIAGFSSFAPVAAEILVDDRGQVSARHITADEIGL